MLCTIVISVYTTRIILQVLGVDDYGIYQTVGGIAGMVSYIINGSMAFGSSRFIIYEIGKGDEVRLNETFSTLLTAHIIIGAIVIILAESIGLWLMYYKLVIPQERFDAALFTFHLSVLSSIVGITQIPYSAIIIGHEKMNIYAYLSIAEALFKLLIVYLLSVSNWDKLITYALLLLIVQFGITTFYRLYCLHNFKESHYHFVWRKDLLGKVLKFSSWNMIENTSISLNAQGTTLLLNIFFSSSVVTARSVANIVSITATNFISNFRTAVNPQIVKRFANNDKEGSKMLLLSSARYSYYLMLILALPIFFVAEPLLQLWLMEVPEYTVLFLQFAIVTALFNVFDQSFYAGLTAKGQIKESTIFSILIGYASFPIIFILMKVRCSPISLCWVMLFSSVILSFIVKPILMIKVMDYKWEEIKKMFTSCIIVTLISVPVPITIYVFRQNIFNNIFIEFVCIGLLCIVCAVVSIWRFGLDVENRKQIMTIIKNRLKI